MSLASLVNAGLSHLGVRLVRVERDTGSRPVNPYPLDAAGADDHDVEANKLLNLLSYAKDDASRYNAKAFESGYHSLTIGNHRFEGQRDPEQRLKGVPFDFTSASVLDLGCNQGGMLFSIADRIQAGIGVDFDYKMVNAANRIRACKALDHLHFYVFDLAREDFQLLRNFLPGEKVDIVFLLSVCMWLPNWTAVIDAARSMSDNLLFESNGSDDQQREQEAYVRHAYANVVVVREASTDDRKQARRRLFLCRTATSGASHGRLRSGAWRRPNSG
jgi:SAM-dependent methyltransferase